MDAHQITIMNALISIEQRLTNIELSIASLHGEIGSIDKTCAKMKAHIDFVEQTYNAIRGGPFSYFIKSDEPKRLCQNENKTDP